MKQYYYASGDQQLGPFTYQELQSKNLSKDTFVWYEGLSDWTRAGDLQELNSLFEAPPAQPQAPQNQPFNQALNQPPPPSQQAGYNQGGYNQGGYNQGYNQPMSNEGKPKTWLVESILCTLFCCLIGGIIGIVYASQVDSKWARGDIQGARSASETAKIWVMVSFGVGLVILVFYAIAIIGGGGF